MTREPVWKRALVILALSILGWLLIAVAFLMLFGSCAAVKTVARVGGPAALGALAGAVVGGPVGAAVGGGAGAVTGSALSDVEAFKSGDVIGSDALEKQRERERESIREAIANLGKDLRVVADSAATARNIAETTREITDAVRDQGAGVWTWIKRLAWTVLAVLMLVAFIMWRSGGVRTTILALLRRNRSVLGSPVTPGKEEAAGP